MSLFRNLLRGAGSVLDIWPAPNPPLQFLSLDEFLAEARAGRDDPRKAQTDMKVICDNLVKDVTVWR